MFLGEDVSEAPTEELGSSGIYPGGVLKISEQGSWTSSAELLGFRITVFMDFRQGRLLK